jgi:hypothetical protein
MQTRAARVLPTVAALLALGFTSACGGSASDGGDKPEQPEVSSAPTSASAPPAQDSESGGSANALTRKELDKAALVTADVPGYTVKTPSADDISGAGEEKAARAACQPIASVIGGVPQPEPSELIYRQLLSTATDEAAQGLILFEMLAAYERGPAEQMLADLRSAMEECSGGFTTTSGGETTHYTAVKELSAPAGAADDDAVAYQVDGDVEGEKVPLLFTVVRSGSTVAVFYSMNLMDSAKADVPQSVVTAQLNKLT